MDKRERMANQLMMRGHATVDELMLVSFGEWPPKGLDIVHTNDQRVNLYASLQEYDASIDPDSESVGGSKYKNLLGLASIAGERNIYLQTMSRRAGILGHEAVHILQGDHSMRGHDLMGYNPQPALYAEYNGTPVSAKVMDDQFYGHFDITRITGKLSDVWNEAAHKKLEKVGKAVDYLVNGLEVQARIHEILIAGYPRWGQLPATQAELFAALYSAGMHVPDAALQYLNAQPDPRALGETFKNCRPLMANATRAARDINYIQRGFDDEGQHAFWFKTLPRLYADLIEMYGDRHGRERFGLGDNATHAYRQQYKHDIWLLQQTRWQTHTDENNITYVYATTENELHARSLQSALYNAGIHHQRRDLQDCTCFDIEAQDRLADILKGVTTQPEAAAPLKAAAAQRAP